MPKIVLYSCLLNHRDSLKPIEFKDDFHYVLFTDLPDSSTDWEIRPLVRTFSDPIRTARYHKHHPFQLFPEADYVIWLDMSHWSYTSLQPLLTEHFLTLHRNHFRSSVQEEVELCAAKHFDTPELLSAQLEHYQQQGFPDKSGLYNTSCLIWRNTPESRRLSHLWWQEICRWSRRDQVSLPYCLWRLGLEPELIPGVNRGGYSPYFKYQAHDGGSTNFGWLIPLL